MGKKIYTEVRKTKKKKSYLNINEYKWKKTDIMVTRSGICRKAMEGSSEIKNNYNTLSNRQFKFEKHIII